MASATIHTLKTLASVPEGYFSDENVKFVQNKATEVLRREFKQDILFNRGGVVRIMERVIDERRECVPRMNQRAVMYLTNEFRVHSLNVDKHLKWEAQYVNSQKLYNMDTGSSHFDQQKYKQPNRLGFPSVGGTTRFYFT